MADEYPKALYNPASGAEPGPQNTIYVRNARAEKHWKQAGLKPVPKAKAADLAKEQ